MVVTLHCIQKKVFLFYVTIANAHLLLQIDFCNKFSFCIFLFLKLYFTQEMVNNNKNKNQENRV